MHAGVCGRSGPKDKKKESLLLLIGLGLIDRAAGGGGRSSSVRGIRIRPTTVGEAGGRALAYISHPFFWHAPSTPTIEDPSLNHRHRSGGPIWIDRTYGRAVCFFVWGRRKARGQPPAHSSVRSIRSHPPSLCSSSSCVILPPCYTRNRIDRFHTMDSHISPLPLSHAIGQCKARGARPDRSINTGAGSQPRTPGGASPVLSLSAFGPCLFALAGSVSVGGSRGDHAR